MATVHEIEYIGGELELFAEATNWKRYVSAQVQPFLGPDVLEVGAGIGGTTASLCRGNHQRWCCLEPDGRLLEGLRERLADNQLPACCEPKLGTLADLDPGEQFDAILYMDVLEHIENDAAEAAQAAQLLKPGGRLIILAPAHQSLYTPFDRAIGHFRRYSKRMLAAAVPRGLEQLRLRYLDCVGLSASLANRLLLRQAMPTARQISLWDRGMVPISGWLDPLLGYSLGKSVFGVWRRK